MQQLLSSMISCSKKAGSLKKWISAALLCVMLIGVGGCTGSGEGNAVDNSAVSGQPGKTESSSAESMGRYVEKVCSLPESLGGRKAFTKLENGDLALCDYFGNYYTSSDEGESWEAVNLQSLKDLTAEKYISDIAIGPDGSVAVIIFSGQEETADASSAEETVEDDGGAEANDGENPSTMVTTEEMDIQYDYYLIQPDGTLVTDFNVNIDEQTYENPVSNMYLLNFYFNSEGNLFASDFRCVYEVDKETGQLKKLVEGSRMPDYVAFAGSKLYVFGNTSLEVYDLEQGALVDEDQVLKDFYQENLSGKDGSYSDYYKMLIAEGEEDNTLYFAWQGGLYRHVENGNVMEQIVDGNISSFGDPLLMLNGMATLANGDFIVLYSDSSLIRYTYDADIPTVPGNQLKVYSLQENATIKQAISLYQKKNPDCYVLYETGYTGEGTLTLNDAVKNLNTQLLSGEGPDIILMDSMPVDSYIEKGMLEDLSPIIEELKQETAYFDNMLEAWRTEKGLFAVPLKFVLPLIAGDRQSVQNITDLKTLADEMEMIRAENPEGSITGTYDPQSTLNLLAISSSSSWMNESSINREALTEFLTQTKRISDTEMEGLTSEEIEDNKSNKDGYNITGLDTANARNYTSIRALETLQGRSHLAMGNVKSLDFDFAILTSMKLFVPDYEYMSWQGQIANGFTPRGIMGISSQGKQKELAADFVKSLLSRENQDVDTMDGFPVNRDSFTNLCSNEELENSTTGSMAVSGHDGSYIAFDVYWPDREELTKLTEYADNADTCLIDNDMITDAVREYGTKALEEEISIEDAVDEIMKKVSIYLAE